MLRTQQLTGTDGITLHKQTRPAGSRYFAQTHTRAGGTWRAAMELDRAAPLYRPMTPASHVTHRLPGARASKSVFH